MGARTRTRTAGDPFRRGLGWLWLLLALGLAPLPAEGQAAAEDLRSGWFIRPPYMMERQEGNLTVLTGLEIQFSRQLFEGTGYRPEFAPLSWAESLQGLRQGTIDFVTGAYEIESRKEFAHYSIPYRHEKMALYYRRGDPDFAEVRTLRELFALLRERPHRMGYTTGFAVGAQDVQQFFDDPPPTLERVPSSGYADNLALMLEGAIDFFIANPVVMDRMLLAEDLGAVVVKGKVTVGRIPVHVLFSKVTVTPEEVALFNGRIERLLETGTIRRLSINTILPFYLTVTTSQPWFEGITALGIIAFSLSGVILARRERYNVFGALILGTLPAIGGGVLRDLFLGSGRIFVLETPFHFVAAVVVVLLSFVLLRSVDWFRARRKAGVVAASFGETGRLARFFGGLYHFFDAWAVAAFTIIGVSAAVEAAATPLWLWGPAMGVLTASGGVVLRDMVRAEFNIAMLKKDSFAEVSILGGGLYTGALLLFPEQLSGGAHLPVTLGFIFVLFVLRFLILQRGWSNPFQFGDAVEGPEVRLALLREREKALWQYLAALHADSPGTESRADLEAWHNRFFYEWTALRKELEGMAEASRETARMPAYRDAVHRLHLLSHLEAVLYESAAEGPDPRTRSGPVDRELAAEFRDLLGQVGDEVARPGTEGRAELREKHAALREACRARRDGPASAVPSDPRWLYRMERMTYLLGEYLQATGEREDLRARKARGGRTGGLLLRGG